MAKWGEGDPRWIVEERPDATNVNNWHWTEKNADAWSKAKIKELFENHVIEVPSVGNVILEEVDKIEGEARANNRKGKLIFFYEWEIAVKWKGHANGKDTEVTGKIEIPNLSEEHEDMEDVDVDVTLTTKGPEATVLKVIITIKQTKDDCKVSIEQSGVPSKEVESTREGWHRYYFHAMKRSFGFGASLF